MSSTPNKRRHPGNDEVSSSTTTPSFLQRWTPSFLVGSSKKRRKVDVTLGTDSTATRRLQLDMPSSLTTNTTKSPSMATSILPQPVVTTTANANAAAAVPAGATSPATAVATASRMPPRINSNNNSSSSHTSPWKASNNFATNGFSVVSYNAAKQQQQLVPFSTSHRRRSYRPKSKLLVPATSVSQRRESTKWNAQVAARLLQQSKASFPIPTDEDSRNFAAYTAVRGKRQLGTNQTASRLPPFETRRVSFQAQETTDAPKNSDVCRRVDTPMMRQHRHSFQDDQEEEESKASSTTSYSVDIPPTLPLAPLKTYSAKAPFEFTIVQADNDHDVCTSDLVGSVFPDESLGKVRTRTWNTCVKEKDVEYVPPKEEHEEEEQAPKETPAEIVEVVEEKETGKETKRMRPEGWGNLFNDLNKGKWKCLACNTYSPNEETKCLSCEEPKPWQCAACNTYSPQAETKCVKCETPRPNGSKDSKTASGGPTGFTFGTNATGGFRFGTTQPQEKQPNSGENHAGAVTVGGFTFGAKPAEETPDKQAKVSFGTKTEEAAETSDKAPASSSFSFGEKPQEEPKPFSFGTTTPTDKVAFRFGTKPASDTKPEEKKSEDGPTFSFALPKRQEASSMSLSSVDSKASFSFGTGSQPATASTVAAAATTTSAPVSLLGTAPPPNGQKKKKRALLDASSDTNGGTKTSSGPAFSFGSATTTTTTPAAFSFGQDKDKAAPPQSGKPTFAFGSANKAGSDGGGAAETQAPAPPASNAAPAFVFGSANKPPATTTDATPPFGAATPAPPAKDTKPAFRFGASSTQAATPAPPLLGTAPSFGTTTTAPAATPAFSFGAASTSAPPPAPSFGASTTAPGFGAAPSFGGAPNTAAAPASTAAPGFGGAPNTAAAPGFGASSTAAAPAPASTAAPGFGGAPSTAAAAGTRGFGTAPSTAAATPQPSFGATPSFGAPAPAAPATAAPTFGGSGFGFGATPAPATTTPSFGANAAAASVPNFGNAPQQQPGGYARGGFGTGAPQSAGPPMSTPNVPTFSIGTSGKTTGRRRILRAKRPPGTTKR